MALSVEQKNHALFAAVRKDDLNVVKHYMHCGATDFSTAYAIACNKRSTKCESYLKNLIIGRAKWMV